MSTAASTVEIISDRIVTGDESDGYPKHRETVFEVDGERFRRIGERLHCTGVVIQCLSRPVAKTASGTKVAPWLGTVRDGQALTVFAPVDGAPEYEPTDAERAVREMADDGSLAALLPA